jgi:vitellogenic carboxypeptidase-like protein
MQIKNYSLNNLEVLSMNESKKCNHKGIMPVKSIPGNLLGTSEINLKGKSYAGYASTKNGNNLFTWFFECQKCVGEANAGDFPLLIWLNGGPGASSMAGLLMENGPYLIGLNDIGNIVENPYAWNKETHIMYWDNPIGSGYSYNDDGKYVNSEDKLSEQFYEALQVFFNTYPQYRSCPLFVTGESYGGKYIPAISEKILEKNQEFRDANKNDLIINIKGMSIGNPWMDASLQTKLRLKLGFELGFLDTKQHNTLLEQYNLLPELITSGQWKAAFDLNQNLKKELVACGGGIAIYDVRTWDDGLFGSQVDKYFRLAEVKTALHVPTENPFEDHDETGPVTDHLVIDYVSNTADCPQKRNDKDFVFCLPKLLERKDEDGNPAFRVLLYTGNLDMSCGFMGTEQILYNLDWSNKAAWQDLDRQVWAAPEGNTLGYIKSYENLTQIVIPLSGHLVPTNQPEVSQKMVYNFVFQRKYPVYNPLPLAMDDE